jgi:hypothetical protein
MGDSYNPTSSLVDFILKPGQVLTRHITINELEAVQTALQRLIDVGYITMVTTQDPYSTLLQGDAGAQGPQGTNPGPQGDIGLQGNQGLGGTQGTQGSQGLGGAQGNQGLVGVQGFQGLVGVQGFQGLDGTQGSQGFQA